MAEASAGGQRRSSPPSDGLSITCLPDPLLQNVASYLRTPSRALFAAAVAGTTASTASTAAVLSSTDSDNLDFADVEEPLASRVDDDDLRAALLCMNAREKLKRLKLTNCTNVTGRGLEPLSGSSVLEQIHLSPLRRKTEKETGNSDILVSEEAVLPILESIVDVQGSSLKLLDLPAEFLDSPTPRLTAFLGRYDMLLRSRGYVCNTCGGVCEVSSRWYAGFLQKHTCYSCNQFFCDTDEDECRVYSCEKCKRSY